MTTFRDQVYIDHLESSVDANYYDKLPKKPGFRIYDQSFAQLLGPDPTLTLVEEHDELRFAHEAGVYNKATSSVYFTANWQTNDPIDLYAVNINTHKVTKITDKYPEVVQANGACQYKGNILYCAQGDMKTPSSLVLVDPLAETSTTLLNNFYGRQFNSINDVVIHHETGDIWFTDPCYGYEQSFRPYPDLPSQVYRFVPEDGRVYCVADGFIMCNGLCFSPDYKKLYVTDTGSRRAHNGVGDGHQVIADTFGPATIYVYDVIDKKYLQNRRTFAYADSGVPDGIKCDVLGNVWSGCGDGLHVWNEFGRLIGKVYVGDVVANFMFGKDGIWMFGEKQLYLCKTSFEGALVELEYA